MAGFRSEVDVAVIGAGAAGIGAARRLLTRCRGRPGRRNPRTSGSSAKTTFWSSFIDDDCAPESFV